MNNLEKEKPKKFKATKIFNIFFIICFVGLLFYYLFSAPINNKTITIHISPSQSLSSVTKELENENVVRYGKILKMFIIFLNSEHFISTGDYKFEKNRFVWSVAWDLSRGIHHVIPVKITLREGINNDEITAILADKLPGFRKDLFISNINYKQGYLFPDTYFFFPLTTPEEILSEMSSNFNKKISSLKNEIELKNGHLDAIIKMASIIEKEAKGKEDAYVISGILWKRLALGMPLQVDVAPSTYKEIGLPDSPINNPGITAIDAAVNPVSSSYLYYIHDKNGVAHFAVDYNEHKRNINKYLK